MRVWRGGAIEERVLPQRNHFAGEMDHFAECIIADTAPLTPGEEGLKDMRTIGSIRAVSRLEHNAPSRTLLNPFSFRQRG
jgi:predicted dehydrogenase